MKRNGRENFSLQCEEVFFACFRIRSKIKMKEAKTRQIEKEFISFRFEAKRKNGSETKRNEKILEAKQAKIRCINIALVGSEKFEGKKSEKKRKNFFFCESGPP
jgi:hypothetical protein